MIDVAFCINMVHLCHMKTIPLTHDIRGFSLYLGVKTRFYAVYSRDKIGETVFTQFDKYPKSSDGRRFFLSWAMYIKLMRIENIDERHFYEIEAYNNNWSFRELSRQYDSSLYERLALSKEKDEVRLLAQKGQIIEKPEDAIKDPYVLEFLDLEDKPAYSEYDLETGLIKHSFKDILPDLKIIESIYKVGWAAMLMQALLSINMFVMIRVFAINPDGDLINGTYGIYYKIQQIALFSCFGFSNTIISLLSFNVVLSGKKRIKECIKWGIIDTVIVAGIITILFESLAKPIANLFVLTATGENKEQIISLCQTSIRMASIAYIFMGISLAIQGILQACRKSLAPLIISLLRLIILLVPFALIFIYSDNATSTVWWSFPIAELLTAIVSVLILRGYNSRYVSWKRTNTKD